MWRRRRQKEDKKYTHKILYYTLQIPASGEHTADEKAYDAPKGDSSGKHGTEKRTFFALLIVARRRRRGRKRVFYFDVFVCDAREGGRRAARRERLRSERHAARGVETVGET